MYVGAAQARRCACVYAFGAPGGGLSLAGCSWCMYAGAGVTVDWAAVKVCVCVYAYKFSQSSSWDCEACPACHPHKHVVVEASLAGMILGSETSSVLCHCQSCRGVFGKARSVPTDQLAACHPQAPFLRFLLLWDTPLAFIALVLSKHGHQVDICRLTVFTAQWLGG